MSTPRTQVVNLTKLPDKWLKLLIHLQNSIPGVYQCIFPDAEAAKKAAKKMKANVDSHPGWFNLVVTQRGGSVYVIKTQYVQKVVIRDEQG